MKFTKTLTIIYNAIVMFIRIPFQKPYAKHQGIMLEVPQFDKKELTTILSSLLKMRTGDIDDKKWYINTSLTEPNCGEYYRFKKRPSPLVRQFNHHGLSMEDLKFFQGEPPDPIISLVNIYNPN